MITREEYIILKSFDDDLKDKYIVRDNNKEY